VRPGTTVGCMSLRLAMDHPGCVSRLCLMEGIPIGEALARCDAKFAASWYHWFFFGQVQRPAERFINADPGAWYTATAEHMGQEAYEDYRRAIYNPTRSTPCCLTVCGPARRRTAA